MKQLILIFVLSLCGQQNTLFAAGKQPHKGYTEPKNSETCQIRYAYSADGYNQDRDDVAGSAMALALFDRAGLGTQLVHFHFNTNFGGPPKHADQHRKSVLETAVLFGMIDDIGGDDGYFDVSEAPAEKQAAIDHLAREIAASSPKDPLWVFCAGGVQVPYAALVKAVEGGAAIEALKSLTFISHSPANENTARKDSEIKEFSYNWADLKQVSPYVKFIDYKSPMMNQRREGGLNADQNSTAWNQSPRTQHQGVREWQWLEGYGIQVKGFAFSGTKGEWLLERLKAAGDPELGHNSNAEGDASDAGMVFAMLPGGRSDATMEEIQHFFLDTIDPVPVFPYGGVYFRKSNPPEEDWERDYKTAAELGVNIMRHWFMWAVVEVAPGEYDWEDYDKQMDLAARNGIKVIIGEISNGAPEWMYEHLPQGREVGRGNIEKFPGMSASSATSAAPMCLDNEDVLLAAEKFQTALVERYHHHPALLGYDLWNEMHPRDCYCESTQEKFRIWLKEKYGSLEELENAWNRHSFASWENVRPRHSLGPFADALDWLEFQRDNKYRLLHRRVELFRNQDPDHLVTGHSAFVARAASLTRVTYDDWADAAEFDIFGFTYVSSRNGNQPWMLFTSVDFVRAASRGKPFWHAEAEAGSLWLQPQVPGRAREDGRISDAEDVRIWNLVSMAGGATGILYPRWRPLLDGPLWGAFGPMNLDGSVGPKAEMAGKVAKWANAHPDVWQSAPVKGHIGIVWVPETSQFNYAQLGNSQYYAESVRGAYQGFFDSNIQADYVHIDHIDEYPLVYLPYPVMLKQETAQKLITYVENGGYLICEGLPGYFGDRGHVGEVQPNLGLDQLFGAKEKYVEFTPDLLDSLTIQVRDSEITGRLFLQEYSLEGGHSAGTYENGEVAAVEHEYGKGKTLLIGSFPGAGYFKHHSPETREFFSGLLDWGKVIQGVECSDNDVKVRLHDGPGGKYLWVINPSNSTREVSIQLQQNAEGLKPGKDLWGGKPVKWNGSSIKVSVGERDAAVIPLSLAK